jgi:hypothetical protein
MRKAAVIALLAFFPCGLVAARLMLRDGSVIYGRFLSGTPQSIVFQDDTGMRRSFDLNQVQTIDFNAAGPQVEGRDMRGQYGQPNDQYGQPRPDDRDRDRMPGDRFAVLQTGTQISVRTDQTIKSQSASDGQVFPASIAQDVVDQDGRVVIPRGAQASLVIRRIDEGGTFNNGNLVLDLDTVRVNGRVYRVASTDVRAGDANGIGKNKRTGEMVGGGAVLGTLLGAIAGGGKGAAIGAVAGAAAGGGVEVATKGHEIRVPAETVLNFRLDQPLELREVR